MDTNLGEFDEEATVRPTLLTVLCILTFIGSGWSILSNIWSYSSAEKTMTTFAKNMPAHKDSSVSSVNNDTVAIHAGNKRRSLFGERMMSSLSKVMTVDNIRKMAIGGIFCSLLTLIGGLLMWWLRRKGFYIYIIGVVVGLIVPFYLYGSNLMAVGISAFAGFFGLVFIALYALNLKAMR
jgi:hypothetical protein